MGRRSSSRTTRTISYVQPRARSHKLTPIARPRLLRVAPINLRVFEDRRTFYPDNFRPAVALPRASARLVVGKGIYVGRPNTNVSRTDTVRSSFRGSLPHQIGFEVPKNVVLCVRRKRRREVMHALGKAGRGGIGRGRRRHTNEFSEVRC